MAIQLDEQGEIIAPYIIVEASSAMQMEQRVLDFLAEGYDLHGTLSMSPKGTFIQVMIRVKKTVRTPV